MENHVGRLDRIDGDIAFLTFCKDGMSFYGEMSSEWFIEKGIVEGCRVSVRVDDNDMVINVEQLPFIEISPERMAEIHEEIERLFGDIDEDLPQDDY